MLSETGSDGTSPTLGRSAARWPKNQPASQDMLNASTRMPMFVVPLSSQAAPKKSTNAIGSATSNCRGLAMEERSEPEEGSQEQHCPDHDPGRGSSKGEKEASDEPITWPRISHVRHSSMTNRDIERLERDHK